MSFDRFKQIFASHGFVFWNGTKYRAAGIKCTRIKNELISSVLIESIDGYAHYWLDPVQLKERPDER